jgi:hypothetical protein
VYPAGFEPATFWSEARRSIQLSYEYTLYGINSAKRSIRLSYERILHFWSIYQNLKNIKGRLIIKYLVLSDEVESF